MVVMEEVLSEIRRLCLVVVMEKWMAVQYNMWWWKCYRDSGDGEK